MKPTFAENLALITVGLGWMLSIYGGLSQLGDPSPSASQSDIRAHEHLTLLLFLSGVFLLGYAFS
ncbi:hypothetical protein ACO0K0_19405 [Undibacterium sp. SXout11W]|uniref:hypothetical protein n=1 Tax=Undibacterium sp. SXout11W TaxID=3413050 RepID=UPI003BF2159C